ncbi:MAG: UDP-N-acetylmuramoyl-L-alanine--D-glutamate ligase, partial [Bacteroidota bacterium]
NPKALYVAEISSFQLVDIKTFRPDIAILTNITEDHLDRYDYQFENYIRSKFRITMNQQEDDHFIYCADDEVTMKYLNQFNIHSNQLPISMKRDLPNGAFIKDGDMYVRTGQDFTSMSVFDFALKGKHNYYNTMAACVAAATLDIRKEKIRDAVQNFQTLEHRMEHVATVRGVEFINDSKATNVNSTWYALESMTKPTVLVLGGVDKGNDYSLMDELVKEKVRAIICLGKDNTKIHEAFGSMVSNIVDTGTAVEAVQAAFHFASKGDVVLLSPACASFDLFKNYEDRGNQFKKAVKEL